MHEKIKLCNIDYLFVSLFAAHFRILMSGRKRKLAELTSREQVLQVLKIQEQDVEEDIPESIAKKAQHGIRVLAVGQSGIRCAEIVRLLKAKNLFTAKLFAKHLKLEDQKNELMDQRHQAAAGTPNRLIKLAELENEDGGKVLDTSKLHYLVIDLAKDAKQFTLLTQPQVKEDAMAFFDKFIRPFLKSSGGKGKIKIVFFE
jgi:hypothetical protein